MNLFSMSSPHSPETYDREMMHLMLKYPFRCSDIDSVEETVIVPLSAE